MNLQSTKQIAPLTVSQLTNAIKICLESTFPNIYLQGEISNLKIQTSGHLYFSLKDAHAQIAAVMFKVEASFLKILPKAGDQVIIKGELNLYPPKGNYQLIVRELSYVGIGELLQKLEILKLKLHQMGWFKAARKKALPLFPKRIGVVTSPTGAVIQDILNILTRRFSGFHLILNPVKVQGEGAAQEIAQAIEQMNHFDLVDVIIVGRGGGSLEDLWAFNEEIVARAIFNSHIPVISAVGHETDHCIADYVADVRAPTPSAAAEIVIPEKNQQLDYLAILRKRSQQAVYHHIQKYQFRLKGVLKYPLLINPLSLVEWRMQKLDDYKTQFENAFNQFLKQKRNCLDAKIHQASILKPINKISYFKEKCLVYRKSLSQMIHLKIEQEKKKLKAKNEHLNQHCKTKITQLKLSFNVNNFREQIQKLIKIRLQHYNDKFSHLKNLLKAIAPKQILEKGFSILFAEKENSVINSVSQIKKGQQARLLLFDGEVSIIINEVIRNDVKFF